MHPVSELFVKARTLPNVPRVVFELIASMGDERADLGNLVERLRQDPVLVARVLRLANSGYYGGGRKIASIDDALTRIGLNALRTLVVASGVAGAFTKVPGLDLAAYWHHSLLTAVLARRLGRLAGINPEFAYTAGLLHRLGQLMIHLAAPVEAGEIARHWHRQTATELADLEHARLGVNHAEVGAELARRWALPGILQDALGRYIAPLDEMAGPYAGVVSLAAQMAYDLEAGQAPADIVASLPLGLLIRLALDEADFEHELEAAPPEAQAAEALFAA